MNYYISDTHFGHANCLLFDSRPFTDVEEMDTNLLRRWNERVSSGDHIYFLGDFAHRSQHPAGWYLSQLKGHKHLIIGNHDREMLRDPESMRYWESVDKLLTISENFCGKKTKLTMCHYPLVTWPGAGTGSLHVHGHVHGRTNATYCPYLWAQPDSLNAGCMITGYAPATLEELVEFNRRFRVANPQPEYTLPDYPEVSPKVLEKLCPSCGSNLVRVVHGNRATIFCRSCGHVDGGEILF